MLIKLYNSKFIFKFKSNLFNYQYLKYCQSKCALNKQFNDLKYELNERQLNGKQELNGQQLSVNQLNKKQQLNQESNDNLNKELNRDINQHLNTINQNNDSNNELNQKLNLNKEIYENKLNDQLNQDENQNKKPIKEIFKEKKIKRKLMKKDLKDEIRLNRYRNAFGLDDKISDEDGKKILNNYFSGMKPGVRYFEKTGTPIYGLNFNSMFINHDNKQKAPQYKFIEAEQFEKNIIYDFSYDQFMNKKEKNSLVFQLLISLGLNNKSRKPFPLLFANLDKDSYCYKRLNEFYFKANKHSTLKITDKSYLDLLPKDEIIYLSPHADEPLIEFKPNYHYVIGCFIDISFSKNLSFKKSKAEGIKSYKLPIDEFVSYSKARNKLLPLPIVHQILLDKKMNYDWKFALECNLGDSRIEMELDELNEFKMKYKNYKKHLY